MLHVVWSDLTNCLSFVHQIWWVHLFSNWLMWLGCFLTFLAVVISDFSLFWLLFGSLIDAQLLKKGVY